MTTNQDFNKLSTEQINKLFDSLFEESAERRDVAMQDPSATDRHHDNFVDDTTLTHAGQCALLTKLGYYDLPGVISPAATDHCSTTSTMSVLLGGDPSKVRELYAQRELAGFSRKPDGTKPYADENVNLMAQLLHSHERLTEAQIQINFLKNEIEKQLCENETAKPLLKNSQITKRKAKAALDESEEIKLKAEDCMIKSTYKPRFDTLMEHVDSMRAVLKEICVMHDPEARSANDDSMKGVKQTNKIVHKVIDESDEESQLGAEKSWLGPPLPRSFTNLYP